MKRSVKLGVVLFIISFSMLMLTSCTGKLGLNKKADPVSNDTTQKQIKIFMNGLAEGLNEYDKDFIAKAEKVIGYKINFEFPPSANYTERLQIMMASGEYPDVIQFLDPQDSIYLNAVKNGAIIGINQYLKSAENINKYTNAFSWDGLKVNNDGNIYGIPRTSLFRLDGFYVRQDWLDNLGIALPKDRTLTLDEFTDMLKRFSNDDPDKNGNKDTYGLSASAGPNNELMPVVLYPFGCNGWQKTNDGEYPYIDAVYDRNSSSFKDALEYTSMLCKNKYIDPDFATIKSDVAQQRFVQGITGVCKGFAGQMGDIELRLQKVNPNARLSYIYGIKNKEGIVSGGIGAYNEGIQSAGFWGVNAISRKASDPQAIVKMYDWMLSDEGWNLIVKGIDLNGKTARSRFSEFFVRRNNDTDFFISPNTPENRVAELKEYISKSMPMSYPSKDLGFKPPVSMSNDYLDYQKTMTTNIAKIILGEMPVSKYDEILDNWYKAGGEEYVKQMNDYIKSVNKN